MAGFRTLVVTSEPSANEVVEAIVGGFVRLARRES